MVKPEEINSLGFMLSDKKAGLSNWKSGRSAWAENNETFSVKPLVEISERLAGGFSMHRHILFFCCGTLVVLCLQFSHASNLNWIRRLRKPQADGSKTR